MGDLGQVIDGQRKTGSVFIERSGCDFLFGFGLGIKNVSEKYVVD